MSPTSAPAPAPSSYEALAHRLETHEDALRAAFDLLTSGTKHHPPGALLEMVVSELGDAINGATPGAAGLLHTEHPHVAFGVDALQASLDRIVGAYERYVTSVSSAGMALSLPTSTYLDALCRATEPTRVLDLGSGFSSYILRRYAADHGGVDVVSVDDNEGWLEKTGEFLDAVDTPRLGALVPWATFSAQAHEPFDLILHDLAMGGLRDSAMWQAAGLTAPGGWLVLDDAQAPSHRQTMRAVATDGQLEWYSLRRWTLDDIGRWATIAHRPA